MLRKCTHILQQFLRRLETVHALASFADDVSARIVFADDVSACITCAEIEAEQQGYAHAFQHMWGLGHTSGEVVAKVLRSSFTNNCAFTTDDLLLIADHKIHNLGLHVVFWTVMGLVLLSSKLLEDTTHLDVQRFLSAFQQMCRIITQCLDVGRI